MTNDISARLRNATFAGYLYLIGIVIMWSSFRTVGLSARSGGLEEGNAPLYFLVYSVVFAIMAATYVLHVRGYQAVAEKYGLRVMYYAVPVLSLGIVVLPILISMQMFGHAFLDTPESSSELLNGMVGIAVIPYALVPFVLAFSALSLRHKFRTAIAPIIALVVAVPIAAFFYFFFWTPVAEGLFIAAGILFFREIARS